MAVYYLWTEVVHSEILNISEHNLLHGVEYAPPIQLAPKKVKVVKVALREIGFGLYLDSTILHTPRADLLVKHTHSFTTKNHVVDTLQ